MAVLIQDGLHGKLPRVAIEVSIGAQLNRAKLVP